MKENKTISLVAFLAMVFSLTLLCIFLYFGGCKMSCCCKIVSAIIIGIVTAIVSFCIFYCCDNKSYSCKKSLYVEDTGVYILYKAKKKTKFCRVQYYDSVSDMENSKDNTSKIFITEGTNIDKETISFLVNNGYEFSVAESGNLIYVKGASGQNNINNVEKAKMDSNGGK